jgi:hypothetical protein
VHRLSFSFPLKSLLRLHHQFIWPDLSDIEQLIDHLPESFTFDEFCGTLFSMRPVQRALLQPRTYTDLRKSIDKLLLTLEESGESAAARSRRKKGKRVLKSQ